MAKPKDITGIRSGKLVALERAYKKNGLYKWKCQCDCGNIAYVSIAELTSGKTKSCGCLRKDPPLIIKHGFARHNGKKENLYNIWDAMKQRCCNPKNAFYYRYGERGITVCEEWKNDYVSFRKWCLENGYEEGLDLDRIDNDGNYEPNNCRFITHKENLQNTHRKIEVEMDGEILPLSEIAERYGIKYNILWGRYRRGRRGGDLVAEVKRRDSNFISTTHEEKQSADCNG